TYFFDLGILHLLFERSAECFEIRFQKADVSTHYAEMGNLLTLDPKIHSLWADAKISGRLCRCKVRMSGLCKVEMSGFMDGWGSHGNGAHRLEPTRTGPTESAA